MPKIWDTTVASHKERLRQSIIDATIDLVAEHGLADVTMGLVAERAGIGRATVYNYFPDLEHILAAYVVDAYEAHQARLDEHLAGIDDPLERVRAFIDLLVAYFASDEHRLGSAAVTPDQFGPELAPQVEAAQQLFHHRLAQLLAEAVDAGLLRPDPEPELLAELVNHMMAASRAWVMRGRMSAADASATAFRFVVEGAGTTRARRRLGRQG